MSRPLIVTLPPGLHLWGGCVLRVTALDAGTGNEVAGVKVSNISVEVDLISAGPPTPQAPVLLVRER